MNPAPIEPAVERHINAPPDKADAKPWWKAAVFYQIYPRSFVDSNGDGVGDLAGISSRLDYLAKLGVDALWISPFFPSPMKDFGYDVSDYCDVDPMFGTLAAFDDLLAQAHCRGLRLIIDQVWSHTSDQHPWFLASARSREDPKADWYVWADAKPDGTPPNNWQASFGGPAWTWSPRRRQYYLHNFLTSQPDLNFWNPGVQAAVLEVARFWLDRGVDGFRLDVVNYFFHDAALRDNPVADHGRPPSMTYRFQQHLHDISQPETLIFLSRLRRLIDSYPGERMTLGEIAGDGALARQREYTDGPDRLNTAYSFFLLYARRGNPALFREAIEAWQGAAGWPSWSLGNHDVPRFPSRLGADGQADIRQTRALLAVLLCLPGTPFLYQGDELGLPQAQVPFERLRDPFAIAAYTGEAGRDGARTPMPWSAQESHLGFSTADDTWLPVDPSHAALAVGHQDLDPESTLNFVRSFLTLRHARPALGTGNCRLLPAPENILAFERRLEGEHLVCLFELLGEGGVFQHESLSTAALLQSGLGGVLSGCEVDLPPFGGAILSLRVQQEL